MNKIQTFLTAFYIYSTFLILKVTPLSCSDGYVNSGLSCDECGVPMNTPNVKIIGGINAVSHSWPYHALIIQTINFTIITSNVKNISVEFRCGGTIINAGTVVTAAQCIKTSFVYNGTTIDIKSYYQNLEQTIKIYLGLDNVGFIANGLTMPSGSVQVSAEKIIVHQLYNSNTFENDIALIHLSDPVTFNNYIIPACLPFSGNNYPFNGFLVTAVGYGTGTYLQNVQLTVHDTCTTLAKYNKNWTLQYCVGSSNGVKDACQNEIGGGIYTFRQEPLGGKSRYLLAGVISYCGTTNNIVTRTTRYVDWIYSNWKLILSLTKTTTTTANQKTSTFGSLVTTNSENTQQSTTKVSTTGTYIESTQQSIKASTNSSNTNERAIIIACSMIGGLVILILIFVSVVLYRKGYCSNLNCTHTNNTTNTNNTINIVYEQNNNKSDDNESIVGPNEVKIDDSLNCG